MTRYLSIASLGLALSLTGCKVSSPSGFERVVARQVKQRLTVGGKADVNPLPATRENIQTGQQAFSHYCLVCHGPDGQNTGVPFADRMSPPVPPLSSPDVQAYTDGQLRWIISNGIYPSGMPASKGILNDDEIWAIVHYIRHLPPLGSLGEPTVYTGEPQGHTADNGDDRVLKSGNGHPKQGRFHHQTPRDRRSHSCISFGEASRISIQSRTVR